MNRLTVLMPGSIEEATKIQSRGPETVLKAGGVDLLDHLKEGLTQAERLNNLAAIGDGELRQISPGRIGALCTLAQIAADPGIRERAPVIAQAAGETATPQIRNLATAGGNLLQRPRCWYYRSEQFHCLKKGGGRCYAQFGENRYHAVFGPGPCFIVHPSNIAPALIVCNGSVEVVSASGRRALAVADLFAMPEVDVEREHVLGEGEIITGISYEPAPRSAHYEIRERQSFDWPLVIAAVALELGGGRIVSARICAGAVAPVPWRLPRVERALEGLDPSAESELRRACLTAVQGANPLGDNACKLELLPVAVARAVRLAAGMTIDDPFHAARSADGA